jgi:hypothetical protein
MDLLSSRFCRFHGLWIKANLKKLIDCANLLAKKFGAHAQQYA